jgi:hypothetical protein
MTDFVRAQPLRRNGYMSWGLFNDQLFLSPLSGNVVTLEQGLRELEEHERESAERHEDGEAA